MGGMTVLEYIRLYGSDDLDRIVIVDISPRSLNDETWHFGRKNGTYTLANLEEDHAQMRADFKAFLHSYYLGSQRGYAQRTPEAQRRIVEERMIGHHPMVLTNLWYSMNLRDHRSVLPAITCPAAIFHAEILPSCSKEAARYYDDHIAAPHRVVLFDGCSHALISEQPERFAAELLDFFEFSR